ncbi:hypothetical protein GCM10023232_09120 [Sphingosinicella ginsenosidimutans]|uniref:Transmembrane protein n=1 Tax=Allosphingosinicella ginsenosidimutans TaxID=1176539 RepID=A0A5C6TWJ4_9SPHN|nr:hypothetical protein [Sphingosinicella ginsenosidimutans]TXC64717.1 hypothetical protein FRZ32_14305 [Sphingosinicella ginsenosidimutans]
MTETVDPREAIEIVHRARERIAARNPSPAWYAPIYGLLCGALVAGGGSPQPWGMLVVGGSVLGLGLLYRAWSDRAGISLNGYRPGRTRTIAISLAFLLVLFMVGGLALRTGLGWWWAPIAFGLVTVPIAALGSSLWDRAWRAELTGGER